MKYSEIEASYLKLAKASNKKSTYKSQEPRIRIHLRPFLKGLEMPLTSEQEIELKAQINEKDISPQYKRTIWIMYSQLVNHARNAMGIENSRVKIKGFRRPPRNIYTIWDFRQYGKFREQLKDKTETAFFDLLYFGGLRRGEAMALTRRDNGNEDEGGDTDNKAPERRIQGTGGAGGLQAVSGAVVFKPQEKTGRRSGKGRTSKGEDTRPETQPHYNASLRRNDTAGDSAQSGTRRHEHTI